MIIHFQEFFYSFTEILTYMEEIGFSIIGIKFHYMELLTCHLFTVEKTQ